MKNSFLSNLPKLDLFRFLFGFFLPPWIYIFAYLVAISIFAWIKQYSLESNLANSPGVLALQSNLVQLDLFLIFFVIGNYSLDFFAGKSHPQLRVLSFYISILALALFTVYLL